MNWLKNIELHRWLEYGLILIFLVAGIFIAFGNEYSVLNWFQTDDAFYYFKVAQNIVEGKGSTFDGINLTNGYHPLWLIVCLPVFVLARWDLVLPLRIIILISVSLGAISSVFLFRMLRLIIEEKIAFLITILWAFSLPYFRNNMMGGMETGISAFFIILLWYRTVVLNQKDTINLRDILTVGIIAVFTFLSRLDNIFLVLLAGVWIWVRWWQPVKKTALNRERWMWRLQTGFAYFLPVTVVLFAYLGINSLIFGTAMPISSQVKVWWETLGWTVYGARLYTYIEYIYEYLLPTTRGVGPWSLVTEHIHSAAKVFWARQGREFTFEPLVLTYGGIGLVLALIILPGYKRFLKISGRLGLFPFLAGCMLHSIYYFWRDSYHLRAWYWVSENLFLLLFLGILLSTLISYFRKIRFSNEVILLGVSIFAVFTLVDFGSWIADKTYPELYSVPHYYQKQEQLIRAAIPPDAVISAIGSGSIGYFMPDYQVVNLDGLVNSVEYFEQLKSGTAIEFLAEMNVEYIIGKEYLVTKARPYAENFSNYIEYYGNYEVESDIWSIWKVASPP
ncbi:MAG TPA: hypothetical protein VLA32_09745 [Anaerolineales bacterium]|nr:hypothetical protein [Anaerolineales bacterium]